MPFVVPLLLLSWPCCVVAASSFFFSLEVSYPSFSVVVVCLWLLVLVLLIDCVFLGVHCVCLLLHWHFLRVFSAFFLVFCKNESYGLPYGLYELLIRIGHTDGQSVWVFFKKYFSFTEIIIRIVNLDGFFFKKKKYFSFIEIAIRIMVFFKKKKLF